MEIDLDVFKEPRGFMRLLQFIFSICAFATTTSYESYFSFKVPCKNNASSDEVIDQAFSYPFKLDHIKVDRKICDEEQSFHYFGDMSSDAQFFVATGVLTMLYSLASIVFYLLFNKLYGSNRIFPMMDFLISLVLGVFWLSGSAAWASGLDSLKYVTNPDNFVKHIKFCAMTTCIAMFAGNFAKLTISVIFGFLNFFLWACDLWFLYKETPWFTGIISSSQPDIPGP